MSRGRLWLLNAAHAHAATAIGKANERGVLHFLAYWLQVNNNSVDHFFRTLPTTCATLPCREKVRGQILQNMLRAGCLLDVLTP
ncbi:hypothetical protein GGS20DRAFT_264824 [Poronia punctata]|nr:hypothetical protein GGS20DRAFT_264824 [Poronia punctata]